MSQDPSSVPNDHAYASKREDAHYPRLWAVFSRIEDDIDRWIVSTSTEKSALEIARIINEDLDLASAHPIHQYQGEDAARVMISEKSKSHPNFGGVFSLANIINALRVKTGWKVIDPLPVEVWLKEQLFIVQLEEGTYMLLPRGVYRQPTDRVHLFLGSD